MAYGATSKRLFRNFPTGFPPTFPHSFPQVDLDKQKQRYLPVPPFQYVVIATTMRLNNFISYPCSPATSGTINYNKSLVFQSFIIPPNFLPVCPHVEHKNLGRHADKTEFVFFEAFAVILEERIPIGKIHVAAYFGKIFQIT